MSEERDVNETTSTETPNQSAQQSLDDLTVLSHIDDQSMGQARLNAVRPTDVSDGAFGTLATIHQGSTAHPSVQEGFLAQTGDVMAAGMDIETVDTQTVSPETLTTPPTPGTEEAAAEPDTAPNLTGQSDLYGGNIIFGSGIGGETAVSTGAPLTSSDEIPTVEVVAETFVPAATEEPLHIDQLPVFGGVEVVFDGAPETTGPYDMVGKEGESLSFRVNAYDPDGGDVTIRFDGAQHGNIQYDSASGQYVYQPYPDQSDWFGTETVTVYVRDDEGNEISRTITINLENVDDAAVATITGGTGAESTTDAATVVSGTISATDVDGAIVGYEVVADDKLHNGTLTVDDNGNFVFTAKDGNWNGSDSFTIRVTDELGGTTDVTVPITVTPTDDAAVITSPDHVDITVGQDGVGSGDLNATDPDGDTLTYGVIDPATGDLVQTLDTEYGTVVVDPTTGEYTFTPNDNAKTLDDGESATDTFQVAVTDGNTISTPQTVDVTIDGANDAPVVTSATTDLATGEDGAVSGQITATDVDTHDTVTYTLVTPAGEHVTSMTTEYGTVEINPSTGEYTFTPKDGLQALDDGDTVTDGFQVAAYDGTVYSDAKDVSVSISGSNDAPVVTTADNLTVGEDGTASGSVAGTDVDAHDTVTYTLVTPAGEHVTSMTTEYGTVEINPTTGEYTFTPKDGLQALDDGDTVTDGFQVAAYDGTAYSDAKDVSVSISGSNDAPVVTTADNLTVGEDGTASGSVAGTDVDAHDTVTYTLVTPAGEHVTSMTTEYGTVEINPTTGEYTFTPNADQQALDDGEQATDSFQVAAYDGTAYSDAKDVNVTITGSNDGPVVEVSNVTTDEDTAVSGQVVASDVDGDSLSYSFGTDTGTGQPILTLDTANGSVTIDAATGQYTFTPNDNADKLDDGEQATDSFQVYVSDGTTTTAQDVNVTITGSNDGPVVDVSTVTTDEDTAVSGQVVASDVDGDSLSYSFGTDTGTGQPILTLDTANGSVTIDAATGQYTFTPNDNADKLDDGEQATDSFQVYVSDGTTTTAQDVNVTITGSNDGPVVDVSTVTTDEDTAVSGQVVASDVDGDSLSYSFGTDTGTGQPILTLDTANGSVTIDAATGQYTFTPNDNADKLDDGEQATDSFQVYVSDGTTTTAQDVNVTITGSNDGPVVDVSTVTTDEDTAVSGQVVASDVDGDSLSYSFGTDTGTGQPILTLDTANGSVTIDAATGQYTFTPNDNADKLDDGEQVTDSFQVYVSDGTTTTAQDVNVTITGSDDATVVTGTVDLGSMAEDSGSVTFTQAQLLGNATDVDDTLSVANVSADGGTLVDNGDGTWTFTPEGNFSGTIALSYDVVTDDGDVTHDSATLAVTGVADGAAIDAADVVIDRALGSDDVLTGTSGADTLVGGGGADTLTGGGGDDVLYGDASATDTGSYTVALDIDVSKLDSSETLSALTLTGLPENASLSAGVHNADGSWTVSVDDLDGLTMTVDNPVGDGFDIGLAVTTTDGTSTLETTDSLHVSYTGTASGDDVLSGGAGNDTLYGGAGNDTLTGGAGADLLDGGAGDDTFVLSGEDGAWSSGYAAKNVGDVATDGTNELVGIAGDKVNADVIRGGEGTDTLLGTSGNDAIFLDDGYSPAATSGARLDSVEVINAGDGNDVVDLTSDRYTYGDVTIDGGSGNDVVWGNAGDDLLIGGSGNDNLYGSSGADTLLGGEGNDTLNGGAGADTLSGGAGDDLVVAKGAEMAGDVMDGGAGTDTLTIQLTAAEYTDAVRAELLEFKQFIAEHPGETFTFDTLGGATATNFEAVTVTVDGDSISLNNPPTVTEVTGGTAAESTTDAATQVTGSIAATDMDGDTLTYSVVDDGKEHNGTFSVDADGNFTFVAKDGNWNGTDSFTIRVSDGQGGTVDQTVNVTVTPTNDAPVVSLVAGGTGSESTTDAPTQVTGSITATDVDGDTLSYSVVDDGSSHNGTLDVAADGTFTFTATDSNWSGSDSFTVQVSDGHGGTVEQTVTINVEAANDAPDAVDDTVTVEAATTDTSAQAPSLSVDISDAVVDTTTSTETSTTTTYDTSRDSNAVNTGMTTPADWSGLGTLSGTTTYASTVTGTSGDDAYSSGTWEANISTGAGNDTVNVMWGNTGNINTGEGDDLVKSSSKVTDVSLGSGDDKLDVGTEISGDLNAGEGDDLVKVGTNVNGDVNLGSGDDYINIGQYLNGKENTFDAGEGDDVVKVGLNAQTADMNLGSGDDYLSVGRELQGKLEAGEGDDTVIIGGNVADLGGADSTIDLGTGNDYLNIGGETLGGGTVFAGQGDDTVVFGQSGKWSGDGTIDMGTGNDSLTVNGHVQNTLIGGEGQDTLVLTNYTLQDWNSNTDNVRDHVSGFEKIVLSDGVVGGVTETTTTTTTTTTSTYTYTVAIDAGLTDTDGSETLSSATMAHVPAGATVTVNGEELAANDDGSYTVPLNSSGDAVVTITANSALDLSGVTTSVDSTEANGNVPATTTVTGEGVEAGDTTGGGGESASVTIDASTLLANDSDVDGDSLSISGVGNASHGTVTLDAEGNVVFTPEDGFVGTATFEYTVSDGHGGTDTATVSVEVTASNEAPVVSAVTGGTGAESTTAAATTVTGSIAASDADGDTLSYSVVDDGSSHNGTLAIDADGNFTFTAKDASWDGTDTFKVQVSDGQGGTVEVPVTITVTPVADTPVVSVSVGALAQTTISVTDLGGSAGYDNTYGYYILDDNGNPTTGQILFDDTSASGNVNQTVTIEGVDPSRIGYFIIPNGDDKNCGLQNGESVSFSQDANGNWRVVDSDGNVLRGEGMNVIFSDSSLNSDGLNHVVDNSVNGNQNWEDLAGGGDADFNDVNIQTATTTTANAANTAFDFDANGSSASSSVSGSGWGGKVYGGAGNDTLTGACGTDTLYGGSGNDTIRAGSGDIAYGGSGNDTITADTSSCNGATLIGNAGNDVITGDDGNDVIYGDDTTESSGGYAYAALDISGSTTDSAETLTYVVSGLPEGVALVNAAGVELAANADGSYSLTADQLAGLELKVPTDGSVTALDLTVTATSHEGVTEASAETTTHLDLSSFVSDGADTLSGGGGADKLYGGGGDDTFVFSADGSAWGTTYVDQGGAAKDGTDKSVSGSGYMETDDTYFGGSGHDTLTMSSGNDAVHISNLNSVEVINAGAGDDIVDLNYSDGSSYGAVTVDGGSGNDYIFSNDGNDTLYGGTGNDYISGNAGDDKMYGGDGTDTLYGGSGDDLLNGGAGADKLVGGSGTDTADYSDSASGVNVYLGAGDGNGYGGSGGYGTGGDAQGDTYSSIENVNGSSHDDYVYGAAGGTTANLGAGNDTFDNSEASSVVASDTVDGGAGNDLIYTGNGDDLLIGGSGNDTLYGEAGNDTLMGGTGDDVMYGGDGSDTFLFDFDSGHDTVVGGTGANWTDTLDLTNLGEGVTVDINLNGGDSWTVTTDSTEHVTSLAADSDGSVIIHNVDGSTEQVDFHSLEQIKW